MKEETEKMHRKETTLQGLRASAGIGGFAFLETMWASLYTLYILWSEMIKNVHTLD